MAVFSVTEAMVEWLESLGYAASSRVPLDMPDEFVTVTRVGGGVQSYVDHPSMAVQAWAKTDAEAEELANSVRLDLITGEPPDGIHSLRAQEGPYEFFDPESRRARYQLVLSVSCQLEI